MEVNRRLHRRLLAGQTSHYSMEKRYVRKDGSLVWGELTVSLVRDDRGRPLSVHAQVQDISERRRAVEALDRRARHGEAAAELGRIALVASDIDELAQRTAEVVAERLNADSCSVVEVNGVELHTLAAVGDGTGRRPGERWTMRARSLAGLVFAADGPLIVDDLRSDEVDASAQLLGSGMRSAMGVSVEGRDGPAGMLAVFTKAPREWTAEEVAFLHVVANVMGSAIERSAREAAAVHRSLHDPLTGLPNRNLFADRLEPDARARPPRRAAAGGADRRPRPVQARQRLARPPGRRRAAARGRAAARRRGARDRHGGALRRRRVRRARATASAASSDALELAQRLVAVLDEPVDVAGCPVYVSRLVRGRVRGARRATPRACCATPTRRSTAPRSAAAGAASSSTRRCARRRPRGSSSRPACAARSRRAQLSLHYQAVVDLRTGRAARRSRR